MKDGENWVMKGRRRIEEFYDLGNGLFFPKRLQGYTTNTSIGKEATGPSVKVVRCEVNKAIPDSAIELEPLKCVLITKNLKPGSETRTMSVTNSEGETRTFGSSDEFLKYDFSENKATKPVWTAKYSPPPGIPYFFKDVEQARKAIGSFSNRKRSDKEWINEQSSTGSIPKVIALSVGTVVIFGFVGFYFRKTWNSKMESSKNRT